MSIELMQDEWWQTQDQDEDWIRDQEQADKQIFRDQCRSDLEWMALENGQSLDYLTTLWHYHWRNSTIGWLHGVWFGLDPSDPVWEEINLMVNIVEGWR